MERNTIKTFRRMVPALYGLAALVLIFVVPAAGAVERDEFRMGGEQQWYDPRGWFERGGAVEHESDWFDYTFAYGQKGYYGFYGRHGEPLPFGYFGERDLNESPLQYDEYMERNYYTHDWYTREGTLEGWL
jgi:hypothetical protein